MKSTISAKNMKPQPKSNRGGTHQRWCHPRIGVSNNPIDPEIPPAKGISDWDFSLFLIRPPNTIHKFEVVIPIDTVISDRANAQYIIFMDIIYADQVAPSKYRYQVAMTAIRAGP